MRGLNESHWWLKVSSHVSVHHFFYILVKSITTFFRSKTFWSGKNAVIFWLFKDLSMIQVLCKYRVLVKGTACSFSDKRGLNLTGELSHNERWKSYPSDHKVKVTTASNTLPGVKEMSWTRFLNSDEDCLVLQRSCSPAVCVSHLLWVGQETVGQIYAIALQGLPRSISDTLMPVVTLSHKICVKQFKRIEMSGVSKSDTPAQQSLATSLNLNKRSQKKLLFFNWTQKEGSSTEVMG